MRLTNQLGLVGVLGVLCAVAVISSCRASRPIARRARTGEMSVRPGINDELKEGAVDKWISRFEGENREIWRERERIADSMGLKPGMVVADVGAGTGFLSELLADRIRPGGKVYAVEIVPEFIDLISTRAAEHGVSNIEPVLCTDDSVELPASSVDVAFICDTYHHFEYPRSTMATIHQALKPGGELVIVDFLREPGKSRAWILKHVRLSKEAVISEVEDDGFELLDRGDDISYLTENYVVRFRKSD
ncbi:MAG: class I SAM-dependent methyltransferase [Phycisphaerae bacterium]